MKKQHEWEGKWRKHLTAEWRRQGAEAWLNEHRGELDPQIDSSETGIPDAMRAETVDFMVFEHGRYRMPDERVLPWVLLLVKARTSPPLAVIVRDLQDAPVYDRDEEFFHLEERESAIRRRLFPPEVWFTDAQRYSVHCGSPEPVRRRRTCFGMTVYLLNRLRLWEWAKTNYTVMLCRNQLQDCDSRWFPSGPRGQWSEGHSNKERHWAHRRLHLEQSPACHCSITLTGPEKISTSRIPRYNPFPREQEHTQAGYGTENITHRCTEGCQCGLDWRQFHNWRPWEHPFAYNLPEAELWETVWPLGTKKLTLFLKRILWEHKGTEPQRPGWRYKDWRSVNYFARIQAGYYLTLDVKRPKGAKPWRVRYWEQHFHSAKVRQIEDSPGNFFAPGNVLEHLDLIVIASPSRQYLGICADLDHTILRRTVREKKIPGYKKHDSGADVMRYLGCSRATAFRRIKEGFRIPTSQLTTQTRPK